MNWARLRQFNDKLILQSIPKLSDPLPKKRIEGAVIITEQFRGKKDGLKAKMYFMEHGGWQALQSRMSSPSLTDAWVALSVMWSLTNQNLETCYFIGQDKTTLQFIYKYCGPEGESVEPTVNRQLALAATGAFVNITEHPAADHRQRLIDSGAVQALDHVLGVGESHHRYVACFLGLVNLVGSEETKEDPRLQSTPAIIKQIIMAVRTGNMGSGMWAKEELITPLIRLSLNDRNKKTLGAEGVVEMVVGELQGCDDRLKVVKEEDDMDRERALRKDLLLLMQNLCFDESNVERVKATKLNEYLQKLTDDGASMQDEQLRKFVGNLAFKLGMTMVLKSASRPSVAVAVAAAPAAAAGAADAKKDAKDGEKTQITVTPALGSSRPQVMLSYSWSNQATVMKLYQALKSRGYNVWIDVEQMKGSTIEAMANAVENSRIILVGMSKTYKESPNCRLEAEYAVQQRKGIVPLLLEKDYRPDGWLGLVAGTKLFYDFTHAEGFDSRLSQLVHELDVAGARPDLGGGDDSKMSSSPKALSTLRITEVEKWTPAQVINWAKALNLTELENFITQKVGGRAFITLVRAAHSDQVATMQLMEKKFAMSMGALGDLVYELSKVALLE